MMVMLHLCSRMKIRHIKVLLLLSVGLCVVSFLHYYRALHHIPLLKELSISHANLKHLAAIGSFLWEEKVAGRQRSSNMPVRGVQSKASLVWSAVKSETNVETMGTVQQIFPEPSGPMGDLHLRTFQLQDDTTSYFVKDKSGGICFQKGTKTSTKDKLKESQSKKRQTDQQALLSIQSENVSLGPAQNSSKRLVKCRCLQGWHGQYCGVPTVIQHSNLPTKSRLVPREVPRRIINAININHEFDLLHARFHELADVVDLFLVCESNYTAYGTPRRLLFLEQLMNRTFDYMRHKILYIFLDHFPAGGRQNGWIADDYLRSFLSKNGLSRVHGARPDDVFIINDADEIPIWEGLLFLKLFDGWTEPFGFHLRKSIYGFFWKQLGTLDILSGCTVGMLFAVYKDNGILLRRREYFSIPNFRSYEKATGRVLMHWSIGSVVHYAGWHCSWCFKPEGIYYKLISAQNGDFPRWGDFEEKRKLSYIRELIRTGGWFDGSVGNYPPTDPTEHMYAPKYFLDNYDQYEYLLRNLYIKTRLDSEQTSQIIHSAIWRI